MVKRFMSILSHLKIILNFSVSRIFHATKVMGKISDI